MVRKGTRLRGFLGVGVFILLALGANTLLQLLINDYLIGIIAGAVVIGIPVGLTIDNVYYFCKGKEEDVD